MDAETRKALNKAFDILAKADIELEIDACGCCESPFILMKHKGAVILQTNGINIRSKTRYFEEAK